MQPEDVRGRQLLLDTNLLLLWLLEQVDIKQVGVFKRLNTFKPADFLLVNAFALGASEIVLTPHVAAEVSNLAGQLNEPVKGRFRQAFARWLQTAAVEHAVTSRDACALPTHTRLGLTDASIELMAGKGVFVLSTDLDLVVALKKAGLAAVNYNHIRPLS